ncbi:Esterase/lipase [[Actinomadura] parvosata subsp. kistnae]|uniref:Alpha/beta hydrolase n=1 Tax=[Actinomadura] parvosata subsp. kistnae TaxID=1909395 RepID=A0A1V0A1L3_9ACTN|nr:alpha/beta hydrolase [Nonomuraea sp. ATCC 55076]AQZ64090.1 alpha/beta hydrolase [Nonomuraea sp. ATCC 55076]SPL87439.1 Esterase/lipase [Actinomadura parvosata subsp. kistnae]
MPLHPQAREHLARYPSDLDTDLAALDLAAIQEMRAQDAFADHRGPLTKLPFVRDELAEGVPIRIYRADPGDDPLPVVVYFHGGGWVFGSVKRNDATARDLAIRTGAVVVSVDYRLAPEHPFPAAADDAWTVVRDLFARPAFYQSNGSVAVCGDSAGGNLAAVAAWQARDAGLTLAHQVLVYPVLDVAMDTPSYREFAKGFGLDAAEMAWFARQYAPGADPADPRLSPLRLPDMSGLASATVVTAEYDVLRDEGERYAARLAEAGVPVDLRRFEGAVHSFYVLPGLFDQAIEAREYVAERLREHL